MIQGTVTADLEAVVYLEVTYDGTMTFTVPFIVDTGFDSYLSLSADFIAALSLPFLEFGKVTLADKSVVIKSIFQARVNWHGQSRLVRAHEMEEPNLIGMALLQGSKLTVEAEDGGIVLIEANP